MGTNEQLRKYYPNVAPEDYSSTIDDLKKSAKEDLDKREKDFNKDAAPRKFIEFAKRVIEEKKRSKEYVFKSSPEEIWKALWGSKSFKKRFSDVPKLLGFTQLQLGFATLSNGDHINVVQEYGPHQQVKIENELWKKMIKELEDKFRVSPQVVIAS